MEDVDSFFKKNFKVGSHMHLTFDEILFADLITKENAVSLEVNGKIQKGHVHLIPIRVPKLEERLKDPAVEKNELSKIQFLEIWGKLYWLPFGW